MRPILPDARAHPLHRGMVAASRWNRRGAILAAVMLTAVALISCGEPMTRTDDADSTPVHTRIDALVASEWRATDHGGEEALAWTVRTSPPIPDTWPVSEATKVTCYAYAAAQDPANLRDGERVAAPWGTVSYQLGSPQKVSFVRLSPRLELLGTQGVKPLGREDAARMSSDEKLHKDLAGMAAHDKDGGAAAADTLQTYRMWRRLNGVIAGAVLKGHGAFVRALDAK